MAISRAQMRTQLKGGTMKKTKKKAKNSAAKRMKAGGKVRGDGICQRGKTKGRMR